ncbi:MAG: hypothetical protein V7661_05635 [Sulfitobacter sp.]
MKMSSFEYQMTKLDHLILEIDAANESLTPQQQRLTSTNKPIKADAALSPVGVKKPS